MKLKDNPVYKKFIKHKLAIMGLMVIAVLYFLAVFADFLAPYPYDLQTRELFYQPPHKVHFIDRDSKILIRPYIYPYKLTDMMLNTYEEDKSVKVYIKFFTRSHEHKLLGFIPTRIRFFGVPEPYRVFIFGSDYLGRCTFSRLLYGSRISLSIGLIGDFIAFSIGILVGGIAGYFGGKTDNVIMRVTEIIMSFPSMYLIFALRAGFPPDISSVMVFLLITVILSFAGWAGMARIIRGMVLSIREEEFILGAKALGAGDMRIIVRHIIPNTLSYIIVSVTLSIPSYIIGEAALSVMGLGIQEPFPSWGNMLSAARDLRVLTQFSWILVPALAIFITVLSFNFVGDGLRDAVDPNRKKI